MILIINWGKFIFGINNKIINLKKKKKKKKKTIFKKWKYPVKLKV